jgi:hypothetical protein
VAIAGAIDVKAAPRCRSAGITVAHTAGAAFRDGGVRHHRQRVCCRCLLRSQPRRRLGLGIRLGATPRGRHQRTMASPEPRAKQDISTLLGIGHFYFALTGRLSSDNKSPRSEAPNRLRPLMRRNGFLWRLPECAVRTKDAEGSGTPPASLHADLTINESPRTALSGLGQHQTTRRP